MITGNPTEAKVHKLFISTMNILNTPGKLYTVKPINFSFEV